MQDQHVSANSVDPDQTAPKEQSDLGLHYLSFQQLFLMMNTRKLVRILSFFFFFFFKSPIPIIMIPRGAQGKDSVCSSMS